MNKKYISAINNNTSIELNGKNKFILKQGRRRIYLNLAELDTARLYGSRLFDKKVNDDNSRLDKAMQDS